MRPKTLTTWTSEEILFMYNHRSAKRRNAFHDFNRVALMNNRPMRTLAAIAAMRSHIKLGLRKYDINEICKSSLWTLQTRYKPETESDKQGLRVAKIISDSLHKSKTMPVKPPGIFNRIPNKAYGIGIIVSAVMWLILILKG